MAYAFSEQALRRITNAVKRLEEKLASTEQRPSRDKPADWMLHWVIITDTITVDGRYQGKWVEHDVLTDEWTEMAEVWVVGPNDESLTTGARYLARQTGQATATITVTETVEEEEVEEEVEVTWPVMAVTKFNQVEMLMVTVDNLDGTYDGVIRRYNADEEIWEEFGEVVVIEAQERPLVIGEMYSGIRYDDEVYVVNRHPQQGIVREVVISSPAAIDVLAIRDADILRLASDGVPYANIVQILGIDGGTQGRQLVICNDTDTEYVEFVQTIGADTQPPTGIELAQGLTWKIRPHYSVNLWWDESAGNIGRWRLQTYYVPWLLDGPPFPQPPDEVWGIPRIPMGGSINSFPYIKDTDAMDLAASTIVDDGVTAHLTGALKTSIVNGNDDTLDDADFPSAVVHNINAPGGALTYNGMAKRTSSGGGAGSQHFVFIRNGKSSGTMTFTHNSGATPAGTFAFLCPGAVNFALRVGEGVAMVFNGANWLILGQER